MASNAIYDEKVFDGLASAAQGGDLVEALSSTVVLVVTSTEKKVGELTMEELFTLFLVLIVDVADAFASAGNEIGQDQVYQALSDAISMFLQQNHGRWSKEEIEAGVAQLQEAQANADQIASEFEGEMGGQQAAPGGPPAGGGMLSQGV